MKVIYVYEDRFRAETELLVSLATVDSAFCMWNICHSFSSNEARILVGPGKNMSSYFIHVSAKVFELYSLAPD